MIVWVNALFDIMIVAAILLLGILISEKINALEIITYSVFCIIITLFTVLGTKYSNDYISKGFSVLLFFTNHKTRETVLGIIHFAEQVPLNNINTCYLLPDEQEIANGQIATFNKTILVLCKLAFSQRRTANKILSGYCAEAFLEIAFKKEDIEKYKR